MRWKRLVRSARSWLAPHRKPRVRVRRRRTRFPPNLGRDRGERAVMASARRVRYTLRTRSVDARHGRQYPLRAAPRTGGHVAANDVSLHDRAAPRGMRAVAGRLKHPRRRTATHTPVLHHVSFFCTTAPFTGRPRAADRSDRRSPMAGERRSGRRRMTAGLRLAA
ncbi:conserved hypothetical protein [Burkholderia latens]